MLFLTYSPRSYAHVHYRRWWYQRDVFILFNKLQRQDDVFRKVLRLTLDMGVIA